MKKLLVLIAALFSVISAPATAQAINANPSPSGYFINTDLVKQVICNVVENGHSGQVSGTAFFVRDHVLITAAHVVTHDTGCTIDGQPVTITQVNTALDYAILSSPLSPTELLNISCEGYHIGEAYLAVGYALGENLVVQPLTGSFSTETQHGFAGETRLIGKSFPGMSGGPIFNSRGFVVGIVNGGDSEGRASMVSRSLGDTSICH